MHLHLLSTSGTSISFGGLAGAWCFGALIGWFLYSLNRYRTDKVQLSDLVTVIGAVGGAAVLTMFPSQSDLFAAYGIGLFCGFFGYFVVLLIMVSHSGGAFTVAWFLDGRRREPESNEIIPQGTGITVHPMSDPGGEEHGG